MKSFDCRFEVEREGCGVAMRVSALPTLVSMHSPSPPSRRSEGNCMALHNSAWPSHWRKPGYATGLDASRGILRLYLFPHLCLSQGLALILHSRKAYSHRRGMRKTRTSKTKTSKGGGAKGVVVPSPPFPGDSSKELKTSSMYAK